MTFLYLYIVRVPFFLVAMVFIPHFITRSNCSSSFAIMGGFERGVLGALFVTFFHFGSVYLRLAGEYDIPLLLFPREPRVHRLPAAFPVARSVVR